MQLCDLDLVFRRCRFMFESSGKSFPLASGFPGRPVLGRGIAPCLSHSLWSFFILYSYWRQFNIAYTMAFQQGLAPGKELKLARTIACSSSPSRQM